MSDTDTNQASEDELAKQIESITQAMFVTLSEWQAGVPIDWHSAKVKGRADLLTLIRTEKLKLLNEVIHQSTVNLKSAKAVAGWAELRKEQLEAEL